MATDPGEYNVNELLLYADENPGEVQALLDAERAGLNRSTAVQGLEARLDTEAEPGDPEVEPEVEPEPEPPTLDELAEAGDTAGVLRHVGEKLAEANATMATSGAVAEYGAVLLAAADKIAPADDEADAEGEPVPA